MKRKRRRKNAAVTEAMGGEEDPKEEAHQGPSTLADAREEYGPAVEDLEVSEEEDLYRGAEELPQGPVKHAGPDALFEVTLPKVEDRCSLEPMLDILSYSESEWKGNTTKSTLIRKIPLPVWSQGYTKLSQRFESLRRVRGDNYCALRATLFQVLSTSTQPPVWLQVEHISTWAEELEAREGLIGQWMFPSECRQGGGSEDAVQQLKRYMELLQNRWQAAVGCSSMEERRRLCESVFQGGEEELGLLEALKLLMLVRASEFHTTMQEGGDVPVFCWLLYARDSSDCPRTFLFNHLSRVGFSGGLEQVEMFLLGYALQCTIQVYRLYMTDTEEFVTYYPDDHKEDWPCVCLVTEDDRHYNVPVGQHNELQVPEYVPPDCLESKSQKTSRQADCH
ncbi:ubiquitin thioesterase otulin-like isoform X1 [Salvelinus alpinus]|uniref:ubiquitin thioesterase otulin-like isoform X1 n=1 Tax=Salvelinus alpinus TaxID=8036 RepID=UPI0039FC2C18